MFVVGNKKINGESATIGDVSITLKDNWVFVRYGERWDYIGKNHTKYRLYDDIEVSTIQLSDLNPSYHGVACCVKVDGDDKAQRVVGVRSNTGIDQRLTEDISVFLQSVSDDDKWNRRAKWKLSGGVFGWLINTAKALVGYVRQ